MKIFIRTDASYKIGTGHVMRCLTLAQELRKKGAEIYFLSRLHPGNLNSFIRELGFTCLDLPNSEAHPQKIISPKNEYEAWLGVPQEVDAEESLESVSVMVRQAHHVPVMLVDHYGIDSTWEKHFSSFKLIAIDDLANRPHLCQLLLDQNLQPALHQKYPALLPSDCEMLLGPHYALLRQEFAEARQNLLPRKGEISKILIFFGGNDSTNESFKALKACLNLSKKIEIYLVVGAINPHLKMLQDFCMNQKQVQIYTQVKEMSLLMKECDLAIGAGGVTTWERAALGIPTVACSLAENQEALLKSMHQKGCLIYLGRSEKVNEEKIIQVLEDLIQNPDKLRSLSQKSMEVVDGKGAERVASAILNRKEEIRLRSAQLEDSANLFQWRNSEAVRRFSHQSQMISWEEHQAWIAKVLKNPNQALLIGEIDSEALGVLRYDREENTAKVSIYLVPEKMGQGLGVYLLKAGTQWIQEKYPEIQVLIAEILSHNLASQKMFDRAGYVKENSHWVKKM